MLCNTAIESLNGLTLIGVSVALIGCGSNHVESRMAELVHADVETRRAAARALGDEVDSGELVIGALARATADKDAEVRRLSINALAGMGPAARSSLPALKSALDDPEPAVRVRAALAIQRVSPQDGSFVPVLVDAMRAGDGRVLLEVGAMSSEGAWAIATLVQLLSHESAPMRALAAQTLGHIGVATRPAKSALERALRDPHVAVQRAARQALERIDKNSGGRRKNAAGN